jgi:methylmalonyl-CoA/ethylmalonyl-CoA epimerase
MNAKAEMSPFLNLHHIGWVVRDLNKAIEQFEVLGIGPWRRFTLPSAGPGHDLTTWEHYGKSGADFKYQIANAKMGPIQVEIFECISGDSIPQRFLDTHGEGIWHMSYVVTPEEFDKAVADMTSKGFKVIGSSKSADGTRMVYFDTDKVGGVVFQLHDSDAF